MAIVTVCAHRNKCTGKLGACEHKNTHTNKILNKNILEMIYNGTQNEWI